MDEDDVLPELRRKMLHRVLENLRRALYCLHAFHGIERGNPRFSDPQIFKLAQDALYWQSILLASKAFDYNRDAVSFFKLRDLRPEIIARVAATASFDLPRLDRFADKLRKIRNRALAHDDLDDLERDRNVWNEHRITAGEFIGCAEFAFASLNEMLNAEFGEQVELLNYTGADAEDLVRTANKLGLPAKWSQWNA